MKFGKTLQGRARPTLLETGGLKSSAWPQTNVLDCGSAAYVSYTPGQAYTLFLSLACREANNLNI